LDQIRRDEEAKAKEQIRKEEEAKAKVQMQAEIQKQKEAFVLQQK
tara:strand:+ start:388 stop:522 length:135 start_codon:yes stop_codon:yes gene_type:complete